MNNDLLSSLKLFIKKYGKDFLDDIKIIGNYLYTHIDEKYIPECEILMICIKLDYHKDLLICADENERLFVKKNILEFLSENEGLNKNLCQKTIDILENALFEKIINIESEVKKSRDNKEEESKKITNKYKKQKVDIKRVVKDMIKRIRLGTERVVNDMIKRIRLGIKRIAKNKILLKRIRIIIIGTSIILLVIIIACIKNCSVNHSKKSNTMFPQKINNEKENKMGNEKGQAIKTNTESTNINSTTQQQNTSFELAKIIIAGNTINGTLQKNETHYYIVQVETGTLTAYTTGNTDTKIWLYNKSKDLLVFNDDISDSNKNAKISCMVNSGAYFIRVGGYNNTSGTYTLLSSIQPTQTVKTTTKTEPPKAGSTNAQPNQEVKKDASKAGSTNAQPSQEVKKEVPQASTPAKSQTQQANTLNGSTWEYINNNDSGNRYRLSFSGNNSVTFVIYNNDGSMRLESYNGSYNLQGNNLTVTIEGERYYYTYTQTTIVDNKKQSIIYRKR